jgi:hypothetical protein
MPVKVRKPDKFQGDGRCIPSPYLLKKQRIRRLFSFFKWFYHISDPANIYVVIPTFRYFLGILFCAVSRHMHRFSSGVAARGSGDNYANDVIIYHFKFL